MIIHTRLFHAIALIFPAALLVFCGHAVAPGAPDGSTQRPDTSVILPPPPTPAVPAVNDTAFAVTGVRSWYLIGDSLTKGHDTLVARIAAPAGTRRIDLFLNESWTCTLDRADSLFSLRLALHPLPAGCHSLLFSADTAETAFAQFPINRSAPYYVTVSNDWEDPKSGDLDSHLVIAAGFHESHPGLVMTHFVGPYFFTDPDVTEQRKQWLSAMLAAMRNTRGDEIGLHIHPWCQFVRAAGIACITENDFTGEPSDTTGYGTGCYRYDEPVFLRLLQAADSLFLLRGLGKPTSFRAGGWSCALHTLRALERAGYRVDASGCNVSLMDELWGLKSVDWLDSNWHAITDTSQPYYPSVNDISRPLPPPHSLILEIPDNGLLADYVSAGEMIAVFNRNWNGAPLAHPRMCSIGFHMDNLQGYLDRIERVLTHIDYYQASRDGGPVVYARMSDCVRVWQRPETGVVRR